MNYIGDNKKATQRKNGFVNYFVYRTNNKLLTCNKKEQANACSFLHIEDVVNGKPPSDEGGVSCS